MDFEARVAKMQELDLELMDLKEKERLILTDLKMCRTEMNAVRKNIQALEETMPPVGDDQ